MSRTPMHIILAAVALVVTSPAGATEVPAKPLGLVQPFKPAEFLALPATAQALYVTGIMEGFDYTVYGYSTEQHEAFVRCASRSSLGETAQAVADTLKAQGSEAEGVAYAFAKTMGARCKDHP